MFDQMRFINISILYSIWYVYIRKDSCVSMEKCACASMELKMVSNQVGIKNTIDFRENKKIIHNNKNPENFILSGSIRDRSRYPTPNVVS